MKNNFLIVGLGNIGDRYKRNRHNIGFLVLDYILDRFEIKKNLKLKNSIIFERNFLNLNKKVKGFFMYPTTYMNNSGIAIKEFFEIFPEKDFEIIVIHDDIDLKFGKIRLKKKSGHGGHNGVKSIINEIGSNDFYRIKVGIGRPDSKENIPSYVLSDFSTSEFEEIKNKVYPRALKATISLLFYPENIVKSMINQ